MIQLFHNITGIIHEPSLKLYTLTGLFVFLLLLFFLSFVGMLATSTTLSLLHIKKSKDRAKIFADLVSSNGYAFLVFGVFPMFLSIIVWQLWLFDSHKSFSVQLSITMLFSFFSYIFLYVYRRNLHPLLGVIGLMGLTAASFNFMGTLDVVMFPEKWPFLNPFFLINFSITFLIHFTLFLIVSMLFTAVFILFRFNFWKETSLSPESIHYYYIKYVACGMILGSSFILQPLLIWDLATLPQFALTLTNYLIYLLIAGVSLIIFLLSLKMIFNRAKIYGRTLLFLGFAIFVAFVLNIAILQANANSDFYEANIYKLSGNQDELIAERQVLYSKNARIDVNLGQTIFEQRCTACHRWDSDLVGPSYLSVLPKYIDKIENLYAFVRKPIKRDPKFIAMPKLGLNETEIKSVSQYLIDRFKQEKKEPSK